MMTPERWQQLKPLFHSALAQPLHARAAFLDAVCAADADLRAEIKSLLAAHEQTGEFLDAPAYEVAAGLLTDGESASLVGQSVGHYRLVRRLGAGGMGEVYLATDTRTGRQVALKLLPAHFTTEEQRVRRFRQEAQTVLALNHPNIVTIYEIGEAGGAHFIASELIEGETLRARLLRGEMNVGEALEIAAQVAAALSAAHAAGVVHRDIKPENIMLRPDGYVKALDFGLAKLTEKTTPSQPADSAAATQVHVSTDAGTVLGTISYMSPEQARGLAVDARTDIWSLGVCLYEMVANRPPFERETKGDVLAAILHTEPPALHRYAPDAPAELARIVTKALRKDSEERYQSIKELGLDLKSLKQRLEFEAELERTGTPERNREAGQPTAKSVDGDLIPGATPAATIPVAEARTDGADEVHTTSSAEYLAGEIKRHRRGVAVGLAILLLAAIGVGLWFFSNRSATNRQLDSIAVLPFVNESGSADVEYLSDGMTESLINSLSQLPNLNVKARSSVFRYKGKGAEAQTVGRELNVQAVLNGRVVQRGQDLTLYLELVDAQTGNRMWGDRYDRRQTDLVALQNEIARDVSNKLRVKLSGADEQRLTKNYTENAEAYRLYLKGRYHWNRRTKKDVEKAIEYFDQAIAVDPNYALAYSGLSDAYSVISFGRPSREKIQKAREAALKALSLDNNLAEAHTAFGRILGAYDHDFAGAEREHRRAIELNPNFVTARFWYAQLLGTQGRWEESSAQFRLALELEPLSLIVNANYGHQLTFTRRYDEAIAHLKKTLELDENFIATHGNLAAAYQLKGDYAASVGALAREREINGEYEVAALMRDSFAKGGWEGFLRYVTEDRRATRTFYSVAAFHAALGEKDKAFAALNKSYEDREAPLTRLNIDPLLDPLRDDPRFQELLRRVGLPQ